MAEAREVASGTNEWSAAYARYLMRAAGQSAETLRLYDQVLGCVSRGRLVPATLRDSMSRFLQAHGGECTGRAAELGARFFTELIPWGAGCAPEGAEAAMPDVPVAGVPPRFNSADPIGWFRRLVEYAMRLNRRRVKAYQAQLDQVAAGEMAPSHLLKAMSAGYDRQLPEQLRHAVRLCFDLLSGLTDLRAGCAEEYLRRVLATVKPREMDAEFVLCLSAPPGETASAFLSLANTRKHRTAICCAVTDVRRADGVGPAFAPKITIAPDGLLLEPDQEADVRLSLRLDAAVYEPDTVYVGALHVTRHGEPRLEVQLAITATGIAKDPS
jgi:hypothetical protein